MITSTENEMLESEMLESEMPEDELAADALALASEPANDIGAELPEADRMRGVEAILFAAPAAMTADAIAAQLKLDVTVVNALLHDLQNEYAMRGVHLTEAAGRWRFQTAPDLAPHLTFVKSRPMKLSRAAMESLAVIAYHQPLTRTEIENIRGVAIHKGTLDILLETGWIKPGKRREIPGRPLTWVTTDAFLEHFGLASTRELPGVAELKSAGLLDKRPAIALVPERDDTPEPETPDENDLSDFLPETQASG